VEIAEAEPEEAHTLNWATPPSTAGQVAVRPA
jgi:hypothetical protein